MTTGGVDSPNDLAKKIDDEFASLRGSDEIEAFLTEYSAYSQREYHSETDISVLTTIDRGTDIRNYTSITACDSPSNSIL